MPRCNVIEEKKRAFSSRLTKLQLCHVSTNLSKHVSVGCGQTEIWDFLVFGLFHLSLQSKVHQSPWKVVTHGGVTLGDHFPCFKHGFETTLGLFCTVFAKKPCFQRPFWSMVYVLDGWGLKDSENALHSFLTKCYGNVSWQIGADMQFPLRLSELKKYFQSRQWVKLESRFDEAQGPINLIRYNRASAEKENYPGLFCCYYGPVRWEGRGRVILAEQGRPCLLVATIRAGSIFFLAMPYSSFTIAAPI